MVDHNRQREPATPQEIWNILREVSESQRETDRRMRDTDRRLRKLDELFNGQWGKLMEALVEGDLIALLRQRGIALDHTSTNHKRDYGGRRWEIDILAVNDSEAVVVEVKTTLKARHVDHFLETLRSFHLAMPEYGSSRSVYGAVTYLRADESSDVYAEGQGLYVIRATGSSAGITNQESFRPRTFGRNTVRTNGAK